MSYKEGPRRPLPAIQQGERQHVTVGTLTVTTNLSLQSPDGDAAMGGIAAHGYVKGRRAQPARDERSEPPMAAPPSGRC